MMTATKNNSRHHPVVFHNVLHGSKEKIELVRVNGMI
jgi:hypothetical protein